MPASGFRLLSSRFSKFRAGLELLKPCVDFRACETAETIHAEHLAAEAAHHGAVDHRPPQLGNIDAAAIRLDALSGQVADEAAGEAIARAGGVENFLQQIPRRHEVAAAVEQHGAVFAALDD